MMSAIGKRGFNMAWYYTFNPPKEIGGEFNTKPGITNDKYPDGRLGPYQLPFGPCWEAHFTWLCYHKDPAIIYDIEQSVLGYFEHQVYGIGNGMTEWIVDATWQNIRDYVRLVCRDRKIDIIDLGEGPWNPLRIEREIKNSKIDR